MNCCLKGIAFKKLFRILFFTILISHTSSIYGQIVKINYTSEDSIKSQYAEFTTNLKITNNQLKEFKKYYDFGFNINLIGYKPSNKIKVGLNSFVDVHVVDNYGYEKFGLRLLLEIGVIHDLAISLSPGFVISSSRKSIGFSLEEYHQLGFSNEISIMFDRHFGLTGRIDISKTREQLREIDLGVGLKIKGKLGSTIIGIVGILVSAMYNAILASQ